jgi:hypothetical protein
MIPKLLFLMKAEHIAALNYLYREENSFFDIRSYKGRFTEESIREYLKVFKNDINGLVLNSADITEYNKARNVVEIYYEGPKILVHAEKPGKYDPNKYLFEVRLPILRPNFETLIQIYWKELTKSNS